MNTVYLNNATKPGNPCVATIGFFDGVHRGHQYLISQVIGEARSCGMESMVITFDAHPRKVLQQDYQPKLLTTLDTKLILLSKTNVDNAVVLHFDQSMAELSACDFMGKILRDRLNVRKLIIGYDNRFGHNRTEDFNDYVRFGRELGIDVIHAQALTVDGVNISSSYIRKQIEAGEIEIANRCLGYPYTLVGKVVDGYHEGRKLGFPTANLDTEQSGQLVPAAGVYAVTARTQRSMEMKRAMMNIGTRPTFDGHETTLETYILNFSDDIYGQTLTVSFMHRIRAEHKFDSPAELVEQLKKDAETVDKQFEKETEDEE